MISIVEEKFCRQGTWAVRCCKAARCSSNLSMVWESLGPWVPSQFRWSLRLFMKPSTSFIQFSGKKKLTALYVKHSSICSIVHPIFAGAKKLFSSSLVASGWVSRLFGLQARLGGHQLCFTKEMARFFQHLKVLLSKHVQQISVGNLWEESQSEMTL